MKRTRIHKGAQNKKIVTEIKILQEQLQSILMEEVQEKIRILLQRYFEGAYKPGKFLARMNKKQRGEAIITRLKIDDVEIVDHHNIFLKTVLVKKKKKLYRKNVSKAEEIKKYLEKF